MLWLWISTGWGLKSIHPLKSHCTKAFKSYSITAGRDSAAPLMSLRLLWPLQPLHSSRTSTISPPCTVAVRSSIYLSIVSHSLTGWCSVRGERRKPAAQRASHKERQLFASVVHDRWNRSWCSSEAPRYWDTYCTTQRKMTGTHSCAHSQSHKHKGTYGLCTSRWWFKQAEALPVVEKCRNGKCSSSQTAQTFICVSKASE